MLWPMILAMHAPIVAFLLLAIFQPTSLWIIGSALAVEQFGYGFGFTAYMLYMMMIADGPHKTAHYAICTGFMALGMMLPGMAAGWIEDQIGYIKFFAWVLVCTIPSFIVIARLKIPADFGKKAPATS
jgi:PAT family beta-lactamase induction signal transducer AmpG